MELRREFHQGAEQRARLVTSPKRARVNSRFRSATGDGDGMAGQQATDPVGEMLTGQGGAADTSDVAAYLDRVAGTPINCARQ